MWRNSACSSSPHLSPNSLQIIADTLYKRYQAFNKILTTHRMFQKEKSQTSNPIIKEREKKGGVPIASEKTYGKHGAWTYSFQGSSGADAIFFRAAKSATRMSITAPCGLAFSKNSCASCESMEWEIGTARLKNMFRNLSWIFVYTIAIQTNPNRICYPCVCVCH